MNTNNLKSFQTAPTIVICWHLPELAALPGMGAGEFLVRCNRNRHLSYLHLKAQEAGAAPHCDKASGWMVGRNVEGTAM